MCIALFLKKIDVFSARANFANISGAHLGAFSYIKIFFFNYGFLVFSKYGQMILNLVHIPHNLMDFDNLEPRMSFLKAYSVAHISDEEVVDGNL